MVVCSPIPCTLILLLDYPNSFVVNYNNFLLGYHTHRGFKGNSDTPHNCPHDWVCLPCLYLILKIITIIWWSRSSILIILLRSSTVVGIVYWLGIWILVSGGNIRFNILIIATPPTLLLRGASSPTSGESQVPISMGLVD